MTSGTVFNRYKERIRMAMKFSKVEVGENVNGPIYEIVTKDEAIKEVLSIVDEMYYQLDQSLSSGRAMENLIHNYLPELDESKFFADYIIELEKERLKDSGYKYEDDEILEDLKLKEKDVRKRMFSVIDGGKKE